MISSKKKSTEYFEKIKSRIPKNIKIDDKSFFDYLYSDQIIFDK